MLKTLFVIMIAAVMLAPSQVDGYGAARVGYTRVTPYGGVQHYSATAVRTPSGGYGVSHTTTGYGANGGAYHAGYGGAYGGAAYGGYHYTGAAAAGGSYHYAYVR